MPMMVVIVEFELRAGAESEFETALKHMQEQVKQYDGFLGETRVAVSAMRKSC